MKRIKRWRGLWKGLEIAMVAALIVFAAFKVGGAYRKAVSYTHLTLPTNSRV